MKSNTKSTQVNVQEAKAEVLPRVPPNQYAEGFEKGFLLGFKLGLEQKPDPKLIREEGFEKGIAHFVTLAEDFMLGEFKLSRDELVSSGAIPVWWIKALVMDFTRRAPAKAEPDRVEPVQLDIGSLVPQKVMSKAKVTKPESENSSL